MQSLNRLAARVAGKVPLRTVLIVPFVLQIVGTVGLVGYLSFKSGQKAVEDLAHQLMDEVGERVEQNLQHYLNVPKQMNQSLADAIRTRVLDWKNFSGLERYFAQQLQVYDTVSTVAIATEQKEFLAVEKALATDALIIRVLNKSTNYAFHYYAANRQGKRIKLTKVRNDYDPHNDPPQGRPWYQAAQKAGQAIWLPVVNLSQGVDHPILTMVNFLPFDNADGKFQGVLAAAVYLPHFATFLEQLKIGETGQVFIIDRQGLLIASSTGETPFQPKLELDYLKNLNPQQWRLSAQNSKNYLTQASVKFLLSQMKNLHQIKQKKNLNFDFYHNRYFLQVNPVSNQSELDGLIITVVPEADFMKQIYANTRTTSLLCIAALIGSITIGILTARWITQSILCLNTLEDKVAERTAELSHVNELLIQEIAERVLIEGKLHSSTHQVRTIFESITDIVLIIDEQKNIQIIPTKILGSSRHETGWLNSIVEEFFQQEDTQESWFAQVRQVLATHQSINFDYSIRINNRDVWFTACLSPFPDNSVVWVARDISDRKLAEQALIESEARFQAFMNYSPLLAWISDGDGKVLYCNRSVELWSQRAASELIGETIFALHPPNIAQEHLENIRYVINTREVLETNESAFTADGTLHDFLTYKFPLIDANGQCLVGGIAADITIRKRAEETLQDSQARLQKLTNNVPGSIYEFVLHPDGSNSLEYTSSAVRDIHELEPEQVLENATLLFDHIHPDDRASYSVAVEISAQTLELFHHEWRIITPSGKLKWLQATSKPERRSNGDIVWYGAVFDITDKKQAEDALRESANRERAIAQVLQRMRQSLDINTIFSTTTEELRRVMKCDRVVIYQFNPDWSGRFVAESVASGWKTLLLAQSNIPHLTDDILESENCAVRAWGVINEPIQDTYLQATQGGIYSQSDSYLASEDIYNTGLSPCHIKLLERFQARAYLIVPIFCGKKLWGLLASYHNTSSRPWSASEINTVVQIGIQLGIALQQAQLLAETRQQSVALQQAAYAADAANRAKSTFLANMSHELRTPLNGIMGYAQILQGDKNCTPKQKEGVDIIYQCGTHLLTLINDILDLSKIEAERLELYPEDIHLPTFLAEMSEIFKLKSIQKDIHFTYLPLNSLPTGIQADNKRLRQVLMNLLSNAVKFTDRGSVTFKVGRIDNDRQEQSPITHQPSPITKIRFQVEDTGIGIPPDQLEKIFLPFEQVGDKSRRSEGTGLGLAISQKIVEMMESKIWVESTLGVGSRFCFDLSLPEILTPTLPMRVKSTESIIGYSGLKKKILVVDDRWENCAVLINMLEPIGFEVLEAANGQEGLEKALEFQPDLILVDLVMPMMDGFEMTRQLRLFTQLKDTVVIAISANAFALDRQKSLESGCNDFLTKPVQAEELLTKMKDYLNVSWIYQERRWEQASTNSPEMVIPAHEELMNLYEAAQSGDIEGVEQECMRLQDLSSEYISFVIRVLKLAQAFEYEEIAKLIDRYLSQDSQ
ncbi:PAS domain S-box protein [Allocoleopsis franciscana]|uniref:Circadian input-output histidine kinase CikA n=1 Tax=Allocoleopsis franciscana PCC 7113 TaxID=1173027 RepID=K9WJE5_9CYAN|nr:PAS domain S-box protein [Allocoleopsis franciscana]AFZ19936.1 PAS domain S-box [Allocoleopsis franciscana PCC 7113]